MMKKSIICIAFLTAMATSGVYAQKAFKAFGETLKTDKRCLYVNSGMKTKSAQHVFKTVNEALECAERLSTSRPAGDNSEIKVYIEPSVYWIDNPDDPAMRLPLEGEGTPFGMKLKFSGIHLIGLSEAAEDVVLACQRGQTQGADGNFTMLHIDGDNITAENITFGNYCNVDLVYPRNSRLNRKKRADAIVQAQLVLCNGKNYKAKNCRFISRLNLCPFSGADDILFEDCYFECTDDALCGTGTYRHCRFTFFSSKPFYATSAQGALFEDCEIHCKTNGIQYLTKASSPVTLRRCAFTSDDPNLKIEWTRKPNPRHKCYMTDCTLNGKPLVVPTTPDIPMPVSFPLFCINNIPEVTDGHWTADAHCPTDLGMYAFEADKTKPAWVFGEGMDGAEGCYGMIQNVKGARLMYTAHHDEEYKGQTVSVNLDPCKGPGQGFGSATGQYMDICIKFDTRSLTGYGVRFVRTPEYDKAVATYLVKYDNGTITQITEPVKCTIFRKGCHVEISSKDTQLSAEIRNGEEKMLLTAAVEPNAYGGIHIQHTGSTGASATVISNLRCIYSE